MSKKDKLQPFSWTWVIISMLIFIVMEVLIGIVVGHFVVGRYVSISLRFTLQGILNLGAYFLGGMVIGIISPGIRIFEPAAGAFLSVGLMFVITFFTPYTFISFSMTKLLIGGAIALVLALVGAQLGKRITGRMK